MLTTNDKEDIHISYLSAVCASASISFDLQRHDDDSTDGIVKKLITFDDGSKYMSSLRIQLKCTSSVSQYTDGEETLQYKLKVKNFNDLCTKCTTPIILGVLVLPEDEKTWVEWSEKELLINGCMYWADFSDKSPSDNKNTVTVSIDKKNVINKDTLLEILEKIAKEEWP
ncbi:DUF4365 domain-containing protein [Blautia obeum]|jgi:hypothetical protein|uniref:DUF4365 domain-containing protein n=1 Tax=Blautia obeum TaxID=40520 RepID=A0A414W139_9FIRM|nr:DUF4365 domain-containing protein [Blautia obeum]RHH18001.1 DUF4365 domain-containing protein [Blautia obeum]